LFSVGMALDVSQRDRLVALLREQVGGVSLCTEAPGGSSCSCMHVDLAPGLQKRIACIT
jgi:hypothetical protein